MGDRAWDRKSKQVIEVPGGVAGLEPGLARGQYDDSGMVRGRYMCRACEQDLILRAVRPTAKQQPHFRHQNSQECPASAERRRQIDLDDQVVIDLRDRLMRAWPGVSICLELPQDPQETEPGQVSPAGLPPAIVVCGPQETVVIERPRSLPGPDQVGARLRAVRAQYGSGATHVWFLAKDPLQFAQCSKLHVAPRGRDRDVHATVAPTEQQLAIVAAGGGVYWLDGQQVLIPYGVHDFTHQPRHGEDWNFTDWRRSKQWHKDWCISHPVPAPDATRWGLVPLSLHQMTSTKASFSLTEARDIMQRLEDVQRARWRRRRADARELHAARHTPPPQHQPLAAAAPGEAAPERPVPAPAAPQAAPPSGTPAGDLPHPDTAIEHTGASENIPATSAVPTTAEPEPARPAAPFDPAPAIPPPPAHPPHMPPVPAPAERQVRRGGLRGVLQRFLGGR